MAYDLLIKNGLVVDGSGLPAFRGDVGVKDGKIVEIGKLSGPASKTIDAGGRAVAPGFIDNHCHYDAQVTWDPLCTFSPEHGATSVIFGNCSLSLAPVRRGTEGRLSEFLSYVEAIPMEVLKTVEFEWETVPQYMEHLDNHLGINVGNLIGHSAVRHYVMGDDCQKAGATDAQLKAMQDVVRDGMQAGALGLSVSREKGHFDPQGVPIPALWADEKEIFAIADVLRELSTGTIQAGGGQYVELKDGMMRRLAEATGRTVVYNSLSQTMRRPNEWKEHMARIEETAALGIRAYPMCSPNRVTQDFTMKNSQVFRGLPTWHPILLMSNEEKLRLYADPEIRAKLHEEAVVHKPDSAVGISSTWWKYIWVNEPVLDKNKWMQFKSIGEIAEEAGQAGHRRVPRSGRRGKARNPLPAGREQYRRRGADQDPDPPQRGDRARRRRRARPVPRRLRLPDEAPRRMGAREARDDPGTGGAAPHLRLGLDLRALRPRPPASGDGGGHRDLRSRHREMRQGGGRARFPGRRLAHQGNRRGRLPHDRQRPGAAGERQAHRRLPGRVLRNTYYKANHA